MTLSFFAVDLLRIGFQSAYNKSRKKELFKCHLQVLGEAMLILQRTGFPEEKINQIRDILNDWMDTQDPED